MVIEWEDANIDRDESDDINVLNPKLVTCRDSGFLFKKTKKYAAMVSSVMDADNTGDTMVTIPMSEVVRIVKYAPSEVLFERKGAKNGENEPKDALNSPQSDD